MTDKLIALDFDGTVVEHEFPKIGSPVPFCIDVLKALIDDGYKIILNTMRSDREDGMYLTDACDYLKSNGIELYGINENPTQKQWTDSPKVYAHIYIDDAAFGCPLIPPYTMHKRPYVDWIKIGKELLNKDFKQTKEE